MSCCSEVYTITDEQNIICCKTKDANAHVHEQTIFIPNYLKVIYGSLWANEKEQKK